MPPSDEELATAAAGGDLAAYDTLMRRFEGLAFKIAYGFAGEREGALDIVQGAFLKAFRQLARFRGQSAWKTWLVRIVLNEGRDWRRRQRRTGDRQQSLDLAGEMAAADPGPLDRALHKERWDRLLRGLRGLNHRQTLALVLRYFEGQRIPEIAAILGCTEITTRNMLSRGLRRLRAEVGSEVEPNHEAV